MIKTKRLAIGEDSCYYSLPDNLVFNPKDMTNSEKCSTNSEPSRMFRGFYESILNGDLVDLNEEDADKVYPKQKVPNYKFEIGPSAVANYRRRVRTVKRKAA